MTIDLPYVQEILILVLKGIPTTLRLTFIPLLIALPFAFLIAVARQRERQSAGPHFPNLRVLHQRDALDRPDFGDVQPVSESAERAREKLGTRV